MTSSKVKQRNVVIYILLIVFIFLIRVIFFAANFGGVEHDSGWYLGVAKNLAQRGIYASYTNTIAEEAPGAYPSLHGRFSVQDSNGFSYFPAGVTVGPGYVFPEALLLKIFGNGWWQYRLWPLIAFTGLLFILFFLVWKLGGVMSLVIFQLWLWSVPQLYTAYAYESYSEHIALFYLLISFIFYYFSTYKNKIYYIVFSGLFLSFSILTKNLFFLPGISFAIPLVWELITHKYKLKILLIRWGLFIVSFLVPIVLFEGYRFIFLTSHFGYSSWQAINQDIQLVFKSGGSGISNFSFSSLDWNFVFKKTMIWIDVGIENVFILWLFFLTLPLLIVKLVNKNYRILILALYAASVISFGWFIFISTYGWARHVWQGLVLGMMLVSIGFGTIFKKLLLKWKKEQLLLAILFFMFILSLIRYENIIFKPILNEATIEKWRINSNMRGLQGFPSNPVLSPSDQKDLVDFFRHNIRNNDRVYYLGWFIMAEASPLVDKVFYSPNRYFYLDQKNPDGGESYAITGPYQQGPWSFEPPGYVQNKASELCKKIVYANPSYLLCILRTGLTYNNPAY